MSVYFRTLLCFLTLFGVVACGGGGSLDRDGGSGGGGAGTISIQLAVTDSEGQASSDLSSANPLTVSATVTDSNGNLVTDTLITFSFQPEGLATFSNDAGTASTGTDGVATIGLLVGESSGSGEVVATISTGETASTTFTSSGTTQQNEQPASLDLFASSIQLASSGSDQIELIALVKDENNVLLEGISVTFSANANANIQLPNPGSIALTGADGIARATLNTLNQPENRIITVTARASGLAESQTLDIEVVGTEVNIDGLSSAIINAPVELTIKVVDSDGEGIPNQQVSLSTLSGTLSDNTPTTLPSGQVMVEYIASSAGQDTISATALNAQGSFDITVQQDDFSFTTLPSADTQLNQNTTLLITWLKNTNAFAGGNVTLTTSRGSIADANKTTDVNGQVSFSIQSDNAGLASVSASGIDGDGNQVSTSAEIEFVATVADTIIVDATPDSVGPGGQTSTITAVVRDPAGNLVKGKVINFLVDDVSGGEITSNQSTTDRSGIASTVFTSLAVSTFEAVKVYATVADTPSVSDFTSLTVGDREFDISIGTGRLIEAPTQSSYSKEFSVFVTDPDSTPIENAQLTFSAPPVKFSLGGVYRKGFWLWDEDALAWFSFTTAECPNEDINGNGILDAGEDANGDTFLTPGNVAVIPSSGVTDGNGQAQVDVSYAKQFGAWADVAITVNGQSLGSESSETQNFSLSVAADDLTVRASPPPSSPYGTGANCNDTN